MVTYHVHRLERADPAIGEDCSPVRKPETLAETAGASGLVQPNELISGLPMCSQAATLTQ